MYNKNLWAFIYDTISCYPRFKKFKEYIDKAKNQ